MEVDRVAEDFMDAARRRTCSMVSTGSYEILEVEDAAFKGHAADLANSHVLENFKIVSRENSSEDYVVVTSLNSLKSSSSVSGYESMSTLSASLESNSFEGTWENRGSVTTLDGIVCPSLSKTSCECVCGQTILGCGERGHQVAGCSEKTEKDGVFDNSLDTNHTNHAGFKANKDLKSYKYSYGTNCKNGLHSDTSGSSALTKKSQCSLPNSHTAHGRTTQSLPRQLTKHSPPLGKAEKSAGDGTKQVLPAMAGEPARLGNSTQKHSRERHSDHTARTFLKRKATADVSRAFSEPNEKDLVAADQLLAVEHPTEWLLNLRISLDSTGLSENCGRSSVTSCSPEVPQLQKRRPPSEEAIKRCIEKHSPAFLQYTNWQCLFPYLMSNQLLDRCAVEIFNNDHMTCMDKCRKFYYEVLPSKGKTAYSRYYDSVANEHEHIGHQTLLELLDDFKV